MQTYGITVVVIGVIAASAAILAIVVAVRAFGRVPPRRPRAPPSPLFFAAEDLGSKASPSNAPYAGPDPEPAEEPAVDAPPPPPRLEVALLSRRAPLHVIIPVSLTLGRILELSLPLRVCWTGDQDLEDVLIGIVLPNEITYGGSLERMAGDGGGAELPGAEVSYASADTHTTISIRLPRLAAGADATVTIPISIKHGAGTAHTLAVSATCEGQEPIERSYELELPEAGPDDALAETPVPAPQGAWICRPDEARRVRELHLPLDRIESTDFAIVET